MLASLLEKQFLQPLSDFRRGRDRTGAPRLERTVGCGSLLVMDTETGAGGVSERVRTPVWENTG